MPHESGSFIILNAWFYHISGLDDEKKAESHMLLLAGYLNLAMAYLKLNDNPRAREHSTKALEMDNKNVKAYFRRGQVSFPTIKVLYVLL